MTVRDRIIEHLRSHPEGVDDDILAAELGLSRRQHANQECRKLESAGVVERRRQNGKTRNLLREGIHARNPAEMSASIRSGLSWEAHRKPDKPWNWEGNVQNTVAGFLASNGFAIRRLADTLTKEHGKDIVAVAPSGQELWVSVKGTPAGTPRTSPYVQAGHYFKDALHDLLRWRDEDESAFLALALPDFVTYRSNANKVAGQLRGLKASILWVFENGKVDTLPNFL
ncbi:MAG TPA: winged helix-turn-helix domain-containing protein [Terriglobales bacterium]|nr:winged helix-turn-helix domain-containing protein [Terriglobales bacterium]